MYIVSRVKKIIAVDPDINICSNNAAFVITLATVRPLLPVLLTTPTADPQLHRSCSSSIWQSKAITWPSWTGSPGGTSSTKTYVNLTTCLPSPDGSIGKQGGKKEVN